MNAEVSDDEDMIFGDEMPAVNNSKKTKSIAQAGKNKPKDNKVEFEKGQTMYINGKPIKIDKSNLCLNKRERTNWLIHLLFVR